MYYELDDAELFLMDVGEYLEATTVMKTYVSLSEESRSKYVERVILDVTRRCSPKANYGITRDVLRNFVVDVLARLEKDYKIQGAS